MVHWWVLVQSSLCWDQIMVVEREREREKAHAHELWQSGRGNLLHDGCMMQNEIPLLFFFASFLLSLFFFLFFFPSIYVFIYLFIYFYISLYIFFFSSVLG
jgi:hypothetical protein